ncbi:MAG: IS5 family transposase, partial [Nitrospirota bacterium]
MKKPSKQPKKQKKGGKKQEKKKYKVRNWKEYNQALVDRGKIFFWITEEAIRNWEEQQKTGKRGKPRTFSNTAIETALTLQQVFHMPLRTGEGFLASILARVAPDLKAPDHSTLSIRAKTLSLSIRIRPLRDEPLHIVADSTGIKIYGEGEWKVRVHGWSKHRTWRKLHIGVDEKTGEILLGEVTGNDKADSEVFGSLLNQLPPRQPIHQVSADGGYDRRACYEALKERGVSRVAIPPQHNAKIWQHGNTRVERLARDENLRRIRKIGRAQWKIEQNYHRRSLAETGMFRLKTIFGDRVSARTFENQRTQLLIRCRALNWMTTLGMP